MPIKTPTVYEKHVIIIDGVEHLVKGMEWTEAIKQAVADGIIENMPDEIFDYVTQNDN
jgi:hypothetical protein